MIKKPDVRATSGGESYSYQWAWWQLHTDNLVDGKPFMRSCPAGFNQWLAISPGAWPVNYQIADGTEGGGWPPSGSSADTNLPVRIQPPSSGTGILMFQTFGKVVVTNTDSSRAGSFAVGFGVVNSNGPHQPIYPYLGVAHDYDINQITQEYIAPGATRSVFLHRLDLVDEAFSPGIPNWPNWKVTPNPDTQLYPAISPMFKNGGQTTLLVGGLYIWGCAT